MNRQWRCLVMPHRLSPVAPLYNRCEHCGQGFFTDYFASRELGRTVRIKVDAAELQRATVRRPNALKAAKGET